jgi:hypothetical protein
VWLTCELLIGFVMNYPSAPCEKTLLSKIWFRETALPRKPALSGVEGSGGPSVSGRSTGYVIYVASYKNGVGYGKWMHIDGWSESVIEYIRGLEQTDWVS